MEKNYVSLKLLIDTERERVLFAEAGKEFVDFLLHILALPLGTFIPLIEKQGMVPGSFGNIYESIDNLSSINCLQSKVDKETLLKAKVDISDDGGTTNNEVPLQLKMLNVASSATSMKFYRCPREDQKCDLHVASYNRTICPMCQNAMKRELYLVHPPSTQRGYVKEVVTYMVMDDLEVKPMSTTSTFTLLNKFNVKEVGALEEKVVVLGMDEVC